MTRTRLNIVEDFGLALRQANLGHSTLGATGKIPKDDQWSNRSIKAVQGAMINALKAARKNATASDQGHVTKLQGLADEFAAQND